jgi:Glutamine amidotransferase domain
MPVCGIAGFFLKDPDWVRRHEAMEKMADMLLLGIENRGKKATGFVAYTPGGHDLIYNKGDVTAKDFIELRDPLPKGARVVLLHTRLDTKGDPGENVNNHPVICKSTFVVHNGSIHNDDELFEEAKAERMGEVDSEAIALVLQQAGFDKAEEALAKLKGSFAIAAVDPIEQPDKLLLAKGEFSPLVYHESDKFLVFASTMTAIKDAWKVVLGTPPEYKTYQDLDKGEFLVVTENGVEKKTFKVQERPKKVESNPTQQPVGIYRSRSTRSESGQATTRPTGNGSSGQTGETKKNVVEIIDGNTGVVHGRWEHAVRYMRQQGKGKAITWQMYHHEHRSIPADVEKEWEFCKGCRQACLKAQVQETLSWGRICVDCYAVAVANQPHQKNNPRNRLSEDDERTLTNWATMEANIHRLTLATVSADTGLDEDLIDFLIFRVPREYIDSNPDIGKLATDLDDLYQEASADEWAGFGVEDADGLHYSNVPASESSEQQQLALPPGNSGATDATKSIGATSAFAGPGSPDLTIKACRVCKHRTKFHMLGFAWCKKHFEACHAPNCDLYEDTKKSKTQVKAVHTTEDGRRLCHYCSRGVKGLLSDKQAVQRGITIAERSPANVQP